MKKSPKVIKTVDIVEFYSQEKKGVYRHWKIMGSKTWFNQLTPYKEIPYVYLPKNWGV
jgi:hypothetical protein